MLSGLSSWSIRPLVERLQRHVHLPLFWNGYTLLFNSFATSGLGILYWALAARYYPTHIVGLNSAMLSAMTFVAGTATLGPNSALVRYIPTAGRGARRLIAYNYGIGLAAAAIASIAFGLGLGRWSTSLSFVGATPGWLIFFVISTLAWCVFNLQDSVLTGLRQTAWVAMENIAFAALKIVLLLVLAGSIP